MRWGLWLSTFGYQRGWRHPSFCPGIFLEFRVSHRQDFVHDQNLVCAPPGSQSPAGLPAAPFLLAAPALRFSIPHPQNGAIQENILILRLPSGAAPFGPTFGCLSYGLPSPPVPDPSIPDENPCRPPATKHRCAMP